jgi:hypothetical protein
MQLTVPAGADQERVDFQIAAFPGQSAGVVGNYYLKMFPKERATWPEMVRKRVEEEAASVTPLAKRWLTLRYVNRKNAQQVWLDGRLLREAKGPLVKPEGHIRLHFYEGSHLASIRFRSLPAEDPIFETVALDHYLNAAQTQRDTLPASVKGVPFAIPPADERGNDHIAVSRSWMRFGALEGAYDGWEGETPRWRGAMYCEPGRIQLRIRNARYSKLHLLASYDGAPDTTPVVTAQFYRDSAGFPVSFSARVEKGKPHLVTIPLDPDGLASLSDLDHVELELTKEVRTHRSFPDPIYYSAHGAGLPSGVRIYAITLERPVVEVDFTPDKFAHIWTAPEKPWYNVTLRNRTQARQRVKLELTTASHDRSEKTSQSTTVNLASAAQDEVKLPITLTKYGHHEVQLRISDESGTRTERRSLAFLHPDTRERGGWTEGKGILWGFWDWGGGHITPGGIPRLQVMADAGAESSMRPLVTSYYTPDELTFAAKHGMLTPFLTYQLTLHKDLLGVEPDVTRPAEMEAALIKALQKSPMATPTAVNKPEYAVMFSEPIVGSVSYRSFPEYYGDPPYEMTADEQKNFKTYLDPFLIMARAIKKTWPQAKIAFPWGIPSFPIAYLRYSPEARDLMDGPAVDLVLFERLPEMQMHQVTYASTLWQLKQEWLKAGKKWPSLISVEGVCTSPGGVPGALTLEQEADHTIRGSLLLAVYNVTQQLGWPTPFRCASHWGETHYGSGMIERQPLLTPKPFYSAHATLTRQLNRMNYVKAIETGSATTFCLQFQHYKTGELLHVFWTVRGERPVMLEANHESRITIYDSMDNLINTPLQGGDLREQREPNRFSGFGGGRETVETVSSPVAAANNPLTRGVNEKRRVTVRASTSPCYVWGLKEDAKVTLGAPDHSDSKPGNNSTVLANLGDGSWNISADRDDDYENVHLEFVKKFPGKMTTQAVSAPKEAGGQALAVHLEKQEKERKTMPFYTTLVPPEPITIPGKASHLGLWVRAASDWGRVVYCLRDANGERWLSVGKKGEWNVDDVHCWSAFNFDGWRYLPFELCGNQPYDCYRDMGTSFWGYYGKGDGIVDLPLTLEKIIVERRTHVIKADEQIAANPEDVLLGDLYAEYEKPADKTDEAVRLSRLRMTAGQGVQGTSQKPQDYNPYR